MASGLTAGYHEPHDSDHGAYGFQNGTDPSSVHRTSQGHRAGLSTDSISSVGIGKPMVGYAAAVKTARSHNHNVQAERPTTGSQHAGGAPSITSGSHVGRRPPRFGQSASSGADSSQVQMAPQSAVQGGSLMVQGALPIKSPYIAYIEPFNAAIQMWYVVIVGKRVGVFATE